METKAAFISRRLFSLSFTLGVISVILSLLLTISPIAADAAAEVNSPLDQSGLGDCGSGGEFKINLSEGENGYTYTSDQIITSVIIKAGSQNQGEACFTFTSDGSDGCYAVSGLGSNTVTVTEVGVGGDSDCKDISHIEFYTNPPPKDTSTPTPTATETTVVPPPEDTSTPTPTATETTVVPPPENTSTPTPTSTVPAIVPPLADTPTPTSTGTATETQPPTLNPPTVTPTSTGTDIVNPPVPSPTSTGSVVPPLPSATATPTSAGQPPASSQPTPTDIVMPPAQTEVSGTLPPPSAPQPRFEQPELVPVTGADHMMVVSVKHSFPQEFFMNVGLGLLGLSLVFYGISKKLQ